MTRLEDALRTTFGADVDDASDQMLTAVRRGARRRRTARTTAAVVAATAVVVAGVALGGSLLTDDDARPSPAPKPTETVTDPASSDPFESALAVEAAGDRLVVTTDDASCDCSVLSVREDGGWRELHRFPVPFVDRLSFTPDGVNGWAAADRQIWATHDGGSTWARLDLPKEAPEVIGDSYVVDASATHAWVVNLGSGSLWRSPVGDDDFTRFDVPGTDWIQDVAVVGDSVVVDPQPVGEGNLTSVPRLSTSGGVGWQELTWPCSGEHRLLDSADAIFTTCEGVGEPEATIYRWVVGTSEFVGFSSRAGNLSRLSPLTRDRILVDDVLVTDSADVPSETGLTADASIWDAARIGEDLYLATTEGLLESVDDGRTWHRI